MLSNTTYSRVSENGTELILLHKETDKELERLPIRQATEEHRNYIISTWVKSYASLNRQTRTAHNGLAWVTDTVKACHGEGKIAERLWQHTRIVTGKEDTYTINGWVCGEPGRLYYAYVPPELRLVGIFSSITKLLHQNDTLECRIPFPYGKRPWLTYNPYCWLSSPQDAAVSLQ